MINVLFTFNAFAVNVFLMAALITLLIVIFSLKFLQGKKHAVSYYLCMLWSLVCVAGALFAADYITLLLFWGMMGIPMYWLIGLSDKEGGAAQKALLTVGGGDVLMVFGIALICVMTRSVQIGALPLLLDNVFSIAAFASIVIGIFAKAGVMPLHRWIPASAEVAPASVLALLPASLDKLLGIALLFRLCFGVFILIPNSPVSVGLIAIGSFTIIAGVLAALTQKTLKKLLAYHAVSQVGYMVLGIGTGLPLGVAGAIFHMFNNALYKTSLFLCAGAVEQKTSTDNLDELGGLAKVMPLTFTAFILAALSISGVPPFNGFVSKWLIYQALLQQIKFNPAWTIPLLAAMVGSAFTLASFIKATHTVFLGQTERKNVGEAWLLWFPPLVLSLMCVVFGVFAFQLPLKYLVVPQVVPAMLLGAWQPGIAVGLLLLGLLFGLVVYFIANLRLTERAPFVGGENLDDEAVKVGGLSFYDAIKNTWIISLLYSIAEAGVFDLFKQGKRVTSFLYVILNRIDAYLSFTILFNNLSKVFIGIIVLEISAEIFLWVAGAREWMTVLLAFVAVSWLGMMIFQYQQKAKVEGFNQ